MGLSDKWRFITDSIHGDIHLNEEEWKVIDTPTFQRLRQIKQLQMAHLVYPNATHTRFAHCLGTLAIMNRILQLENVSVKEEEKRILRLSALLHDIGHYPYSHLIERLDRMVLTEEFVTPTTITTPAYPPHTKVGEIIVTSQQDIINAIGGVETAKQVVNAWSLNKLITGGVDLDRMDYLLRDANATGVPYGKIDLNYLLNHLCVSKDGTICVLEKALPAAEHFLLARFYMHRVVYYHKTICGFEECCRHLFRRLRDTDQYGIPSDGKSIEEIVKSSELFGFTDSFLDSVVNKAVTHKGSDEKDRVIRSLASCVHSRMPPKLLKEVAFWDHGQHQSTHVDILKLNFKQSIKTVAEKFNTPVGRFLFCEPPPIFLERGEARYTPVQFEEMSSEQQTKAREEEKELIKMVSDKSGEPKSLVGFGDKSIISKLAGQKFRIARVYVVPDENGDYGDCEALRKEVENWGKP